MIVALMMDDHQHGTVVALAADQTAVNASWRVVKISRLATPPLAEDSVPNMDEILAKIVAITVLIEQNTRTN